MERSSLFWHRVKFLALIGVFLSPFVGGWLALYVFEWKPENANYGSLVQPVKKIDWPVLDSVDSVRYENGFGKKWTFLLLTTRDCLELCRSNLFYLRQIRTLLGRDTPRLQNVLMSVPKLDSDMKSYLADYPDLIAIEGGSSRSLLSQFQVDDSEPVGTMPRLYLIDPDQNYMMFYPAEYDHYRVLDDIKKLMKLSQIG